MSDLQFALVIIGIVVVLIVYLYNLWQERVLRNRLAHLNEGAADANQSMDNGIASHRIEPTLGAFSGDIKSHDAGFASIDSADLLDLNGIDIDLEYGATLTLASPIGESALRDLRSQLGVFGKPIRIFGWDTNAQDWLLLERGSHARSVKLQIGLLLVNRTGPISAHHISEFCDTLNAWANTHDAEIVLSDVSEALQVSRDLDLFCADVDVIVGFNVIAPEGNAFTGTQIATAAVAVGFNLEPDGLFHWQDAIGQTLFTLENQGQESLSLERLSSVHTNALTLLLDVPRVAHGSEVLEQMAKAGQALAAALGGTLVDDNRIPLVETSIAKIKTQLDSIYASMARRKILAGSQRALRIFA